MNRCRSCGEDFGSVSAFDRHRTGKHELNWPEHADGRRCMDEEEMVAAGMELDPRGRWRIALTEEAQDRLKSLKGSRLAASESLEGSLRTPEASAGEAA